MLQGRGVLRFLDEGGGVLKIKVLRLGAALKVFGIYHPPPPPIVNDRSLSEWLFYVILILVGTIVCKHVVYLKLCNG
jgi:hypothetical protein